MPARVHLLTPPQHPSELQAAIQRLELALVGAAGMARCELLAELGRSLFRRSQLGAATADADLERAIACAEEALADPVAPAPLRTVLRHELAGYLYERFVSTRDQATIARCVTLAREVLAELPQGTADRAAPLSALATYLCGREEETGDLRDLRDGVGLLEEAMKLVSQDNVLYPHLLSNLLVARAQLFEATADPEDLRRVQALQTQAEAVLATPGRNDPLLASNLSVTRGIGFETLGDPARLDRAIEEHDLALASETGDQRVAELLGQLGILLSLRHHQSGRMEDLQRGISALKQAVAAFPASTSLGEHTRHNLAVLLLARYQVSRDRASLDRAIELQEDLCAAIAEERPTWPMAAAMLAASLWRRAELTHARADLDRAIDLFHRGEARMTGAADHPTVLANLGGCLHDRHGATGDDADLLRAEAVLRRAIALTGGDSPRAAGAMANLATVLRDRYQRERRPALLAEAVDSFRNACRQGLEVGVLTALTTAQRWGAWATARESWDEAAEAYGVAWQALRRVFEIQLLRGDKERSLRLAKGVATQLGQALIRAGRIRDAVVAAEKGRAQLLTESLERDRADLEQLRELGHADLLDRYRQAAERLAAFEQAQAAPLQPRGVEAGPPGGGPAAAARAARKDLDDVLGRIREVRGFARFLTEPGLEEIAEAARGRRLVYLLPGAAEGVALVVGGGPQPSIRALPLPELRDDALGERLARYRAAYRAREHDQGAWSSTLDDTAGWLWDAVMGDLVRLLPARTPVILIPTGMLGVLPLHAAWTPAAGRPTGRRYLLDELLVTYAPNARTLSAAEQVWGPAAQRPGRVLAVADPPGTAVRLPYADCETRTACAAFGVGLRLPPESSTPEAVLAALPSSRIAHLACHGWADLAEPLASGLLLAGDQVLTVRDLLGLGLRAQLAVLSACDSGLAGEELPDEVISLPSAMLQAGFGAVVASLWEVSDVATAMLMARFYGAWRDGRRTAAQALQQAQQWVRDTTNGEKAAWLTSAIDDGRAGWPPWPTVEPLHDAVVLRDPEVREFASPGQWAAFAYFGGAVAMALGGKA